MSLLAIDHSSAHSRWSAPNPPTLGLRRSDKNSIAPPKKPCRPTDTVSEPSVRKSPKKSSKKKETTSKTTSKPPPKVIHKKSLEASLKKLDLEDITETECSTFDDSDFLLQSKTNNSLKNSSHSVQTAPAAYRAHQALDKNDRYANFENGFGEQRESRMRRVHRIKSTDRVMPSVDSQLRAIAIRRQRNDGDEVSATQQELQSVRCSASLSVKERMSAFDGNPQEMTSPL
jgi:hypothetical protein